MRTTSNRLPPYKFGWLPDVPDQRDILFRAVFRVPAKAPSHVDLRGGCPAVEQQGNLGSCTAQALVGCLEFLELRELQSGRDPAKNGMPHSWRNVMGAGTVARHGVARLPHTVRHYNKAYSPVSLPQKFSDLSRLFVYYNEREAMGTVLEDSGAMLRTGIKVLKRLGVCREIKWPYTISRFTEKPPRICYREAADHQATAYQRLHTLHEMRACLAMELPFVFGFAVYEQVMTEKVRKNGIIRLPRRNERMIGGHAVMAVGYDDKKQTLLFRNSWGTEWGKAGYGFLPYGYLESRELSDDFWCIQATESNLYAQWKIRQDTALS